MKNNTFCIANWKMNMDFKQIDCYFKEFEDYVPFTDEEDLVKKIHYYLQNEEERKRIAANGRNKTIKKYNGDIFWKKIFKHINFS